MPSIRPSRRTTPLATAAASAVAAVTIATFAVAAAPAPARAQYTQVYASASVDSDERLHAGESTQGLSGASAHAQQPGVNAWATGSLSGAVARLYAGTTGFGASAGSFVGLGTTVTLTNTWTGAAGHGASFNALQVFLDAQFFRTDGDHDAWNDDDFWRGYGLVDVSAGVWDLTNGGQVDALGLSVGSASEVPFAMGSLALPAPATPGASVTYYVNFSFNAIATRGWTADFSHTARLYLPTVEGLTWSAADGAFAEQARPAWAQDATVEGEILPAVTTPEPASLALVGAGGLALGVAARGRRRAARADAGVEGT